MKHTQRGRERLNSPGAQGPRRVPECPHALLPGYVRECDAALVSILAMKAAPSLATLLVRGDDNGKRAALSLLQAMLLPDGGCAHSDVIVRAKKQFCHWWRSYSIWMEMCKLMQLEY